MKINTVNWFTFYINVRNTLKMCPYDKNISSRDVKFKYFRYHYIGGYFQLNMLIAYILPRAESFIGKYGYMISERLKKNTIIHHIGGP